MPPPEDPAGEPEYRVYRSRRSRLPWRRGDDAEELARLRGDAAGRSAVGAAGAPPPAAGRGRSRDPGSYPGAQRAPVLPPPSARGRRGRRRPRSPISGWRIARWVLYLAFCWIVLSVLAFLVSAQIQQGKVSDANQYLGGAGYPLTSANNILVLGSDVRPKSSGEPGAQKTGNGRSDSILLMRVGGGANSRMSIARDTIVDIPGAGRQKINAAYAIGGTALAVQTIEQYTGIDINHVMIVSFEDFPDLIDAMGGITYTGGCVVSRINGGFKNGGYTLRLRAGKTHIDGKQALALARTRKNDCNKREDDLTRARRQQKIVAAMKRRLLSPLAFPRLPLISWNVPKALRSDMSGPTLLGVFGALAVGGSPKTEILGTLSGNVPEDLKQRRVRSFLAG